MSKVVYLDRRGCNNETTPKQSTERDEAFRRKAVIILKDWLRSFPKT